MQGSSVEKNLADFEALLEKCTLRIIQTKTTLKHSLNFTK